MWAAVQPVGSWQGGGLAPIRLDRLEVERRLDGEVPRWILDPLLDAFEPAALAAMNSKAAKDKGKPKPKAEA